MTIMDATVLWADVEIVRANLVKMRLVVVTVKEKISMFEQRYREAESEGNTDSASRLLKELLRYTTLLEQTQSDAARMEIIFEDARRVVNTISRTND
jgi:vacuolar-type H+-ATPase subunit D/Vma8